MKSEKTVPQPLAYPIKRNASGYFVNLEFQIEEKEVKGLAEWLEKKEAMFDRFAGLETPKG